ncbi:MAG TPA: peptidyl-prolyl cis-trans isomerase [Lachnospiraceae bacterium]|nr:peptidyl-prolyl cis-trans isomerase [Lachnospiraceae bacterium]
MKKNKGSLMKRLCVFALCVQMTFSLLLTGCGSKYDQVISVTDAAASQVMVIGDYTVTLSDVYLYLIQYIYNYSLTSADLQTTDSASIMNTVIAEMKLEYVEYQLAKQSGITMTEEQINQSYASAEAFTEFFGEDFLNSYGVAKSDVQALFDRQMYITAITEKATQDMTNDYLAQYEEEYADLKFTSVYYALFPSIQYDENGEPITDASGNHVTLTDAELAEQLAKANELKDRAIAGESMEDLVQEYAIEYCSGVEKNYVGAYSAELNELIATLEVGQISDVIETPAGYMVVRMDNKDDQEYRDYMIQSLAYQSAGSLLPTMQENWMNASGVVNVFPDDTVLASIDLTKLCDVMNANNLVIRSGENNGSN